MIAPLVLCAGASAENVDSWDKAFTEGSVSLSFRYRYEYVDQDGISEDAHASTLRSRLGYKTASWNDLVGQVQVANVTNLFSEDFNSTRNGEDDYPQVADPNGTEVNLAHIDYSGFDDTVLSFGRRRINLDNQRFVGGVGWRQNEQTFDSFGVVHKGFEHLTLRGDHIWRVKRIFGPKTGDPNDSENMSSQLFNINYDRWSVANLTGYVYLLDYDDASSLSSKTFGARVTGLFDVTTDFDIAYVAEFARQSDYQDNSNDYDADYYHLKATGKYDHYGLTLGYEVLGADDSTPGTQFQTPLATGHKFQGWADKFLSTPAGGVQDFYVAGAAGWLGAKWQLIYHDFEADEGSGDWGTEWDFVVAKTFAKMHNFTVKFASYDADDHATDTDKAWFMYAIKFN